MNKEFTWRDIMEIDLLLSDLRRDYYTRPYRRPKWSEGPEPEGALYKEALRRFNQAKQNANAS